MKSRFQLTVWEICVMAFLTAILLLQKELLSFAPNIQLNLLLILLYAKVLGLWRTVLILAVYVFLDAFFWGSLNPIFTTAQWIGWMLGPLITCLCLKKEERTVPLAFWTLLFGFLYSWTMVVPTAFTLTNNLDRLGEYMLVDLPYEIILSVCGFVTVLFLYEPLVKLLRRLWQQQR